MDKRCETFWAKIYLAGDINVIKQVCREYCMQEGLCVTVSPTTFIYTGGEEYGVEVGLINYPRFESHKGKIIAIAIELGDKCRDAACQWSFLVLTPDFTYWNSKREGNE